VNIALVRMIVLYVVMLVLAYWTAQSVLPLYSMDALIAAILQNSPLTLLMTILIQAHLTLQLARNKIWRFNGIPAALTVEVLVLFSVCAVRCFGALHVFQTCKVISAAAVNNNDVHFV